MEQNTTTFEGQNGNSKRAGDGPENQHEIHLETIKKSLRPTGTDNEINNSNRNMTDGISTSKSDLKFLPWMKKLNLSFPYSFKDKIEWELVDELADQTCSWLENVFKKSTATKSSSKECYKLFLDFKSAARDIMIMPILCAPQSWQDGGEKKTEAEAGFSKYLLWAKIFASLFIHDDMMELQMGKPGYFKFIQMNAQVLYKIFSLQYENIEGVIEDIFKGIEFHQLNPDFGQFYPTIVIWYDVAMAYQEEFGITADQMKPLAETKRKEIRYLAWCGQDDQTHLDNLSLRRICRSHTVNMYSIMEFLMLIQGVFPSAALREDIHFLRFQRLSSELFALMNDLISAAKELATEPFPDNLVILYVNKNGMSLTESYAKVVEKHNEKVSEFQQLYEFIRSNSFSPFHDMNNNEAKKDQEVSASAVVDLYALVAGSFFQSHFMMERYRRYFTENLE